MVTPETILVRIADAGHTYFSWRSSGDLDAAHTHTIEAQLLQSVRHELWAASPTPHAGESVAAAVRRSLSDSAFGTIAGERRLARIAGINLLDRELVAHLRLQAARGLRPRLRIQPAPSLAAVPWATIAVPDRWPDRILRPDEADTLFDTDTRLLDLADVSLLAPVSVVRAAGRTTRPAADTEQGAVVYVLDPRIPGQSAFGALGSVLGRQHENSRLIRHLDDRLRSGRVSPKATNGLELVRRHDTDRRLLAELLAEPCARLVFLGHVSCVEDVNGAQTALHMSCPSEIDGTAASVGPHRPFTAADLLLAQMDTTAPMRWPMPARVALIGCASASDLGFAESFGVMLAAVACGAELVAATVWVLPTTAALGAAEDDVDPLAELVIAVDVALAADDPVAELCAWQRTRLDRWRSSGRREHSPVFWASMTCLDTSTVPVPGETWVR